MVRALTKKKGNAPYTRRPAIEQSLAQVVAETPARLRERAAIRDPVDPAYLEAEELVYVIREARRSKDAPTSDAILNRLARRCAHSLKQQVPSTKKFDAAQIRGEIIGRLYDLFAEEWEDPSKDTLDYWEVNFYDAFRLLRLQVIRAELRRHARFESLSQPYLDQDGATTEAEEEPDTSTDGDPTMMLSRLDIVRCIQSMPFELQQVALYKYQGYKTESRDRTEKTVATLCGISGREVRNRLAEIRFRLERMEELS